MNLQLSLTKKWFEMTKAGIKTEDYRDITPYWFKRLYENKYQLDQKLKSFTQNTMTLGYPSKDDKERILKLEHKGIEIREGNPEWGAEPGKVYFVIKHGKIL
ncbi:ASCH domain-containing protein [Chryseobacterium sp.]|jgi:hypothetical protein|uniref:ASCH domain-containing protein n=1 Tax=Chryseobacterium sp. TaxID=1871047 RepID=UPI00283F16A6|nr:ASCH domain-containing protein [Chryseobacterium sp.]MDR3026036.1 ASCH domain-containing protein [Chryseobacterium sp.]